ncbi:MAG: MarR family transcriptional regulator [Candidatus Gastranaerophilales bacterium]|nr:MarR family transcriptional regulator [Candidatus Gastranaerophilales bacterium]
MIKNREIPHFTDSIFYSIEQIARYLEINGKEFFSAITDIITPEEFRTLDVMSCNPEICQRDLAKLILRDRVRTKRILDSLEKKGIIEFYSDLKNRRLVKKMKITENGKIIFEQTSKKIKEKMQPYVNEMYKKFDESKITELKSLLKLLKNALASTAKLQV